jgi:hypothetical protein
VLHPSPGSNDDTFGTSIVLQVMSRIRSLLNLCHYSKVTQLVSAPTVTQYHIPCATCWFPVSMCSLLSQWSIFPFHGWQAFKMFTYLIKASNYSFPCLSPISSRKINLMKRMSMGGRKGKRAVDLTCITKRNLIVFDVRMATPWQRRSGPGRIVAA